MMRSLVTMKMKKSTMKMNSNLIKIRKVNSKQWLFYTLGINGYKCRLMPGKYMVIAKGKEIREFSQIISIEEHITILKMVPEPPIRKVIAFQVYDAKTGEKLSNVLLKLRKAHSKITLQGLSREEGYVVFTVTENWIHTLEVFRKGYISYSTKINMTKGNEDVRSVKVPVMPVETIKPYKVLSSDESKEVEVQPGYFSIVCISDSLSSKLDLELQAWVVDPETKEEEEVSVSNAVKKYSRADLNMSYKEFDNWGSIIRVTSHIDDKWFKIYVRIVSSDITDPQMFNFDQNFKNWLEDDNAKILIFNENKLVQTVYAPSFIERRPHWDIGLLNLGKQKFIKINTWYDFEVERKTFSKHYLNLFKYLNDQPADFDLRGKFGFDSDECIMKLDDHILLDPNNFINAVKKLPIAWISDNLKEDMVEERQQEVELFIQNLVYSIKNVFGGLSLKRLISVFGSHLGVHQSTPLKPGRTMTRTSRQVQF